MQQVLIVLVASPEAHFIPFSPAFRSASAHQAEYIPIDHEISRHSPAGRSPVP